jgi:hypothetical protein
MTMTQVLAENFTSAISKSEFVSFPKSYFGREDEEWHNVPGHVIRPDLRPNPGSIYNGMHIKFSNNWMSYLVVNGTKRPFTSDEIITAYGFEHSQIDALVFHPRSYLEGQLMPTGAALDPDPLKEFLVPNYLQEFKYLTGSRYKYPNRKEMYEKTKKNYFSNIKKRQLRQSSLHLQNKSTIKF